jgi:hypothetical protein
VRPLVTTVHGSQPIALSWPVMHCSIPKPAPIDVCRCWAVRRRLLSVQHGGRNIWPSAVVGDGCLACMVNDRAKKGKCSSVHGPPSACDGQRSHLLQQRRAAILSARLPPTDAGSHCGWQDRISFLCCELELRVPHQLWGLCGQPSSCTSVSATSTCGSPQPHWPRAHWPCNWTRPYCFHARPRDECT